MLFDIELIAEYRLKLPQIKRSGNRVIVKVPATIYSRMNSVRVNGHTSGKGTRNQGHTDVKLPKGCKR